ncbi:MAG: hypothetical protein KUA43_09175 [Hoeflea sp.]|uniref:hypothetical protein n=1 Tax=Hoeflea sp. TaxID=1940281 RepID=UPI001D503D40|nr:hypothetical protein [Hoeflea sp.]MBU4528346.1 hypothetical protein [Alphaproteobacteria bacterium]MBU4543015.1 hypothetical protein [Alphaproteobacteria bacterium]MBU4551706.1 hypothetical protein [Alphaproteobacteria bacterium]MBV1723601.1 hypothetical protein [Hoeflea sp.]MBV1761917.1 hypothetical protein [Hoeflea sp.]
MRKLFHGLNDSNGIFIYNLLIPVEIHSDAQDLFHIDETRIWKNKTEKIETSPIQLKIIKPFFVEKLVSSHVHEYFFRKIFSEYIEKIDNLNIKVCTDGCGIVYIDISARLVGKEILDIRKIQYKILSGENHTEGFCFNKSIFENDLDELILEVFGFVVNGNYSFLPSYFENVILYESEIENHIVSAMNFMSLDGDIYFDSNIRNENGNSYVCGNYNITIFITDSDIFLYQRFSDIIRHLYLGWIYIRHLRSQIQKSYLDIVVAGGNKRVSAADYNNLVSKINLINSFLYLSDGEVVCEWGDEYQIYSVLWRAWGGDKFIESTQSLIDKVKTAFEFKSKQENMKYEGIVQQILGVLTVFSILGVGAQMIEFISSNEDPSSEYRYIASIVLLSISLIFTAIIIYIGRRRG